MGRDFKKVVDFGIEGGRMVGMTSKSTKRNNKERGRLLVKGSTSKYTRHIFMLGVVLGIIIGGIPLQKFPCQKQTYAPKLNYTLLYWCSDYMEGGPMVGSSLENCRSVMASRFDSYTLRMERSLIWLGSGLLNRRP